jgi:hypothetical protein
VKKQTNSQIMFDQLNVGGCDRMVVGFTTTTNVAQGLAGVMVMVLTPLSTIFQLYGGG